MSTLKSISKITYFKTFFRAKVGEDKKDQILTYFCLRKGKTLQGFDALNSHLIIQYENKNETFSSES